MTARGRIWLGAFLLLAAPAQGGAGESGTGALPASFCNRWISHKAAADVAYRAGIDVRGRAVAPADLPQSAPLITPEDLSIPLTVPLARYLRQNGASLPFPELGGSDINLGTLTLRGDSVFLNGKALSEPEQETLAVLCLKPTKPPLKNE